MQYMLLIYHDEGEWDTLGEDERKAVLGDYFAFTEELRAAGAYLGSAPLRSTRTASTTRIRDGEHLVTDGPFAETKEQLGGYFLIEAASDDEARAWAARVPAARYGSIETRPVLQFGAGAPAG